MAQLINEVKRMQLLAGLITESQFNEDLSPTAQSALDSGDYVRITPTTKVTVGKNVVSLNGYFGEIAKIQGDKYKIVDDDYEDVSIVNRKNLEKKFLIEK